jgi:hypothetical protein
MYVEEGTPTTGTYLGEVMAPWEVTSSGYTPKRTRRGNDARKRENVYISNNVH